MTGKRGQTPTVSKRQLRSRSNKVNTKTAKKDQQSPEEPDTAQNRKRKTAIIPKSNEKRPRVLAADAQWCARNASTLTLKAFALEHGYYERRRCHARYKTIIANMSEAEQPRLLQEFENWCLTLDCTAFWKERKRTYALETAASNCSEVINKMLVSDSQGLLEPPHPPQETTESQPIARTTTADLDQQEHANTQQESDNEERHWIIDGNDITSLFLKYRHQADIIPKPVPLESNIQEILALSGVLFWRMNNIANVKWLFLGNNKVPNDTPSFTNDDFMEMVNVVSAIDEEGIAKLRLLTLATSMDQFKSNVVEGIADLLVKLPFDPIADKNQFGEVDIQTRYYDPLLSSIVADTTRKVVLRWPNREDTITTGIRPDAIVSTLVQRAFGQSLGFGEVKLGGDNTTNDSLCLDTLKLAVLSRNSVLKYGHPILTFQVNGKKENVATVISISFYMTQMIHSSFFTMTEIGRITLPEALSCLHSFITLKNIPRHPPQHPPQQHPPQQHPPQQHPHNNIPHNNIPQSCISNRHLNISLPLQVLIPQNYSR
ncbi:hypothetical protein V8B55DRAFT_1595848 [Mucor lusitanicus]